MMTPLAPLKQNLSFTKIWSKLNLINEFRFTLTLTGKGRITIPNDRVAQFLL